MKRRIAASPCSILEGGTELIVNASNDSATLGGGVSRAIHDECGGAVLQAEMRARLADEFDGRLDEGDCLVTSGGASQRFRNVLHVPSVDYRGVKAQLGGGGVERTVTSPGRIQACPEAALREAAVLARGEQRPLSVTFPLLGAGSGGVSPRAVCVAMIAGLRAFFQDDPEAPISDIVLAIPEPDRFELCRALLDAAFGSTP